MENSQEAKQPHNSHNLSDTISQLKLFFIQDDQGFFCFLRREEESLKSRLFFSENNLKQKIMKVTDAEPDISLEVFYALYHTLWPQIENQQCFSLKDAWTSFLGGSTTKGILCPPEKLLSKKRLKDIKKILSQSEGENQLFQDFDVVMKSTLNLKQEIIDYPGQLTQKEDILASLDLIGDFYQKYRDRVKALVQVILQKDQINVSSMSEYDSFLDLLEPKAVMMGDFFNNHWAYRIPMAKAQILLSFDESARPIRENVSKPFFNRVAALPEAPQPLVYFKANGTNAIQPEKEFMLFSLYKQLEIPVPETALLILTNVFHENPDYYYAVQASEVVIGKSASEACENQETYVQQVIGTLLTNSPDEVFQDSSDYSKSKTLFNFENDLFFKPKFMQEDDKKAVNGESLLHSSQMDHLIPEPSKAFLKTLDPHLTMFSWLQNLSQKNQHYKLLLTRLTFQKARHTYQSLLPQYELPSLATCLQEKVFVDPELHADPFNPKILVSKDLVMILTERLQKIQKTTLKNNPLLSTQTLFEDMYPALGNNYLKLRLRCSDPAKAAKTLWEEVKANVDPSKIYSFSGEEEFNSFVHNKKNCNEDLLPEMFLNEYKNKFRSRESPMDQFIQRHTERKKKNLLNLTEILEELRLLIQEELTDSQSIQEIVDFWYSISRNAEKEVRIMEEITLLLSNLPNAELKWLMTLEKYFFRATHDVPESLMPSSIGVTGAFLKKRTLKLTESEKLYLFDKQGNIKKNTSLTGRSNVTCFPEANPDFFLKQYPEFPGYEYASTLFMRLLGVKHLPYHDLIVIEDSNSYPVLLSQKVEGNSVYKVWNNPQVFMNLDPFNTGLLIISAMLINPEDGKEDNFILSPDGKYLIPIDNDHYFLPSTFKKKGDFWNLFAVNTALQTKTLLFCLDEMRKPIPVEVKEHLLSMDFDLLLTSWMEKLVEVQVKYNNLMKRDQSKQFFERGTLMNILFYEQFINNLHWKTQRIKGLLSKTSELTPLDLLKTVEPFAARCYENSFYEGKDLQSRFKAATKQLYTKPPVMGVELVFLTRKLSWSFTTSLKMTSKTMLRFKE